MIGASAAKVDKTSRIVVVGAGVFGLSTADHLLDRGYTSITILDRSDILPAPDAAGRNWFQRIFLQRVKRTELAPAAKA